MARCGYVTGVTSVTGHVTGHVTGVTGVTGHA